MRRALFGFVIGLQLLLLALLLVLVPASHAAVETTYTFEMCAEGWAFSENDATTPGGDWMRSPPGHASTYAMRMAPYPIGANSPNVVYEAYLTSPPQTFSGGSATVVYYTSFDLEEEFDYAYLEKSANGTDWTAVDTMTGLNADYPDFTERSVTFDHPAGPLHLRFHLTSDELVSGNTAAAGQIAVDNIRVPVSRPAEGECGGGGGSSSPPSTSPPPTTPPPGDQCTKKGNAGDNTINGTNGPDKLCGKRGADRLYGRGGADELVGGAGKDLLAGGPGKDECRGGKGEDRYRGCEKRS